MSRKWQILLGIFLTVVLVMGSGLAPAAIAASKKADYKFKWRMPQTMPVGDDHDLRALAFAKEVKEKTDGRIDITVYSGGVLCDWVECYENVMRGDIEIALSSFVMSVATQTARSTDYLSILLPCTSKYSRTGCFYFLSRLRQDR